MSSEGFLCDSEDCCGEPRTMPSGAWLPSVNQCFSAKKKEIVNSKFSKVKISSRVALCAKVPILLAKTASESVDLLRSTMLETQT